MAGTYTNTSDVSEQRSRRHSDTYSRTPTKAWCIIVRCVQVQHRTTNDNITSRRHTNIAVLHLLPIAFISLLMEDDLLILDNKRTCLRQRNYKRCFTLTLMTQNIFWVRIVFCNNFFWHMTKSHKILLKNPGHPSMALNVAGFQIVFNS